MAAADVGGLAAQIAEATQVLHDALASAESRKAANEFILRASEHQLVVGAAVQLAGPSVPPAARFFAFRLLASAATGGRMPAQDPQSVQLRQALLQMVTQSTLAPGGDLAAVPPFVRQKFVQALAAVAVYASEWPAGWPELQPQILEAGRRSPIHASLALTFFRDVAEVLQSDAASRLPTQRRKALQTHLTEASTEVFGAVGVFVGSLFPGCPDLDRAAVLLAQELSSVVPVTKFLKSDIDRFLHQKLADRSLRAEVLQAFSDWLSKDIAKDLKESPDRTKQFLFGICDLAASCRAEGNLSPDDYEVHKAVAMLIRDFVDANKPSCERHPDLQEKCYRAALQLLRYPSVLIQGEALGIVPQMLKAALPDVRKGGAQAPPRTAPIWLGVKAELLPLLFLCTHREIPGGFDLFPLPAGFQKAMEVTSELDAEEDLPAVHKTLKGRVVEIVQAMSPAPAVILESLEFVHEIVPRVLQGANFASYDAALGIAERIMPSVKAAAGPQAIQACKLLLVLILQSAVPGPEHEVRRLEFFGRIGSVLDLLVEAGQDPGNATVVQVFTHLFNIIEAGSKELRTKALYACIGVCKTAPRAIRPVLEPIVSKAAGLLANAHDSQHVLCEALVAASTAAQNFEQQQQLIQNLLAPLVTRWTAVAGALASPEQLVASLLGDRANLEAAHQLVLCFWACFRSSTVPTDSAVITSGGFAKPANGGGDGLSTRNPAGAVVAAVLPGLIAMVQAFHVAFPSDVTRPAAAGTPALKPYLYALDKEEVKALTSSLDSKLKDDETSWENAFPPPPGQDPARVFGGRHLLYNLRLRLYMCLGAALHVVQDGALTNPELPKLLGTAFIDNMELAHPYHLELQLRHVWHDMFGPGGVPAASEALRKSLAAALLPRLLPAAVRTLDRYWQWLRLPDGHPAVATAAGYGAESGGVGNGVAAALLWAMCTGTVMASRTFVEIVCSLALHGGPQPTSGAGSAPGGGGGANGMAAEQPGGGDQPVGGGGRRKDRKGKSGAAGNGEAAMATGGSAAGGGGHEGNSRHTSGFAGAVVTSAEVLEAVQGALVAVTRWQDAKTISHALVGMRMVAVRLMSGGEAHQTLRDVHAAAAEAPQRCVPVIGAVLRPLLELCVSPPAPPPGDGALQTLIGKPFADFFCPERQQGRVDPSQFASGVIAALWPIIWGLCQIFVHVCKRAQAAAEVQHVAHFPALAEVCRLLAQLRRVKEQDVHELVKTMLNSGAEQKVKRAALRVLIRTSVDPEPAPGETWT